MILRCSACSAQNFVPPERLAVREIPPRCWECGRELPLRSAEAGPRRETPRKGPESKMDAGEK